MTEGVGLEIVDFLGKFSPALLHFADDAVPLLLQLDFHGFTQVL